MPHQERSFATTIEDLHRLAAVAHQCTLVLAQDDQGRWFCGRTGAPHYVTGFSCDCQEFCLTQQCVHHAMLLEQLGWVPERGPQMPATRAPALSVPQRFPPVLAPVPVAA